MRTGRLHSRVARSIAICFLTLLAVLFYLPAAFGAEPPYSFEDAKKAVLTSVVMPSELAKTSVVLMYPSVLPAGTLIEDGVSASLTLEEPAYFAWVDPDQEVFGAPGAFVFMFADSIQTLQSLQWPVVNGDDFRAKGTKAIRIFDGDKSFIPTSNELPFIPATVVTADRVKGKDRFLHSLAPTPQGPPVSGPAPCPPGTIEELSPIKERGIAISAVDFDDARLNFAAEQSRFEEAALKAKFEVWAPVNSAEGLGAALERASKELAPGSTFALYIATHGSQVYHTILRHVLTEKEVEIDELVGEPTSPARLNPGYYDECFENKNPKRLKKTAPKCDDLTRHSTNIPDGHAIVQKNAVGWCMLLKVGGKKTCVRFDPKKHLGSILSCRKFLAADSCHSGALTEHDVKGLSVYAASQPNEPAHSYPFPITWQGKVETVFGSAFTEQLLRQPPLDPQRPDQDEPKPEYDGAYASARTAFAKPVSKMYSIKERNGATENIIVTLPITQTPMRFSLPSDKGCAMQRRCLPIGKVGDDSSRLPDTCDGLKSYAQGMPGIMADMVKQGVSFSPDRNRVVNDMLERLEALKKCYPCPEGTVRVWNNCAPEKSAFAIINKMIDEISAFARGGFSSAGTVIALMAVVEPLKRCVHECAPPPEAIIDRLHRACQDYGAYPTAGECTKNCLSPPCKPMPPESAGGLTCFECPPVNTNVHVIDTEDKCGELSQPPYFKTQEACKRSCGNCVEAPKHVTDGKDCYMCTTITAKPPRLESCADLPMPPYYGVKTRCEQDCPNPPCRLIPAGLMKEIPDGTQCWECPSITEDLDHIPPAIALNPKARCEYQVGMYTSKIANSQAFSTALDANINPADFGLQNGVYKLAGGTLTLGSGEAQFSAGIPTQATGMILIDSFEALKADLTKACPGKAGLVIMALRHARVIYRPPRKPAEILVNWIPTIKVDTTYAITPYLPGGSGPTLQNHAHALSTINPLSVIGTGFNSAISYGLQQTPPWYARQATQGVQRSFGSRALGVMSFGIIG